MGLFNSVVSQQVCPSCGNIVEFEVQFKYGNVREMRLYHVGDKVQWGGGIDIGIPGVNQVVVDGAAGLCPTCGKYGPDFEVWIVDNTIASIRLASGKYNFVERQVTYIVIDE
jgi:hypothetical protein